MPSHPSTINPQPTLALLGAGYWGKNLARNFHALGALHTLCDTQQTTLDAYGPDYASVRKTASVDDALADPAITRVAIAAPAALHYGLARRVLDAGKDVFVEKPICLDLPEARDLVQRAAAANRILMVGHLLQYHPLVQKLQSLVAQGELGKLHYITSNRLNLGKIRREENALWNFAPHDLSVILSLAGHQLPEQVRCTGGDYLNTSVADTTLTSLRFGGGIRAHVYVSWLNPFKEQKLTVVGSDGMAVFDDTRPWNEKLLLYRHYLTWANGQVPTPSKAKAEPVLVPEAEPLREECQHFLICCDERRAPRTDGPEGLRVLQVLQAAQASLEADGEAVSPTVGGAGVPPVGFGASPKPSSTLHAPSSSSSHLSAGGLELSGRQRKELAGSQGPLRTEQAGASESLGRGEVVDSSLPRSPSADVPESAGNPPPDYFVHTTAVVDKGAQIGKGTKIWHFSHIMPGARLGERCILGQNVNVDTGVVLGNNVKVQNNVSLYTGVIVEDDVFLGPSCVLTNVTNPRSQINRHSLYEKTIIKRGATIGANATIVCGLTIGRYAFIAAGAVVTKDVSDYALMLGNPARQHGWMSRHGHVLRPDQNNQLLCPEGGYRYVEQSGRLRCLDLDENTPLPAELSKGTRSYDEFK